MSYDFDVRKLDGATMVTCHKCGTFLLPLRDYEVSKSETPSISADSEDFLSGGIHFVLCVISNFFYDLFSLKSRKKKLAQLKKDVLISSPNSLICPRCLSVKKRD